MWDTNTPIRWRLAVAPIPVLIAVSTLLLSNALGWPANDETFTLSDAGCRGAAQIVLPAGVVLYMNAFVLSTIFLVREGLLATVLVGISAMFAILSVIFRNCEFPRTHDVLGGIAVLFATLHMVYHVLTAFTLSKFLVCYMYLVAVIITGCFYLFDDSPRAIGFTISENMLWVMHALFICVALADTSLSHNFLATRWRERFQHTPAFPQ